MEAAEAPVQQTTPKSVDSLITVHNAELSVLRQLQKWLDNRAEIDRQYSEALAKNAELLRSIRPDVSGNKPAKAAKTDKTDKTDWRDLPLLRLCDMLANYTDSVSKAVQENVDELRNTIRVKLETLINEKQEFETVCCTRRSVMQFELHKAGQEVIKHHHEYARAVEQTAVIQARYEALVVRQRSEKLRDVKDRYFRSMALLHMQHNRYCVAVRTANLQSSDYNQSLLPNLFTFGNECLESLMFTAKCLAERLAGGFERRAAHLVTAATQLRSQLGAFLNRSETDSPTRASEDDVNEYVKYLERSCSRSPASSTNLAVKFDASLLHALGSAVGLSVDELSVNELIRDRFAKAQRLVLERLGNTQKDIDLRHKDRVAYERECAALATRLRRSSAECVTAPEDSTFQSHFDEKLTLFAKQRKLMYTNHELATLHVRLRRDRLLLEAFESCVVRLNGGVGVYPPALAPFAAQLNEQVIQIKLAELDDYDDADELLGGLRRRLTGFRSRFRRSRPPGSDGKPLASPVKFARAPNPVGTDSSTYATANATGAADSCKSPYAPASIDEYSMSIRTSPSDLQWQPPQKPPPPPPVPVSAAAVASSSRVEVVEIDEESSLVRRSSKLDSAASQSQTSMSKTSAIQHAPPAEPHSALASVAAARSTAASKTNPYTDSTKANEANQSRTSAILTEEQLAALSDEEWFHGVLPREEVQRLLVADGDYLLRESRNKQNGERQLVLSVQWRGHKHFIVQGGPGAWKFEGSAFATVRELLDAQHRGGLPVTAKSGAVLRHAILRAGWQIKNDDVILETRIGQGNFGEVYKGVYKGRIVAVKKCKETLDGDARSKFLQEGTILRNYDHPNIVKLIGIAAQRNPIMIVMEFVEGGSLHSHLKANRPKLTTIGMVRMCVDAAAGMTYLESKCCIHRDLAARNCLIAHDLTVKIADFGMSREEEVYEVSDGLKQIPIKWTAPEALNLAKYTSKCDVWSFGILMWEIFAGGATPYANMTNQVARDRIERGYRMPAPDGTPEELYAVMRRCWLAEPAERPTFRTLLTELRALEKQFAPPGVSVSVSITDLLALQAQAGLNISYGSFSLAPNGDDIQVHDDDI